MAGLLPRALSGMVILFIAAATTLIMAYVLVESDHPSTQEGFDDLKHIDDVKVEVEKVQTRLKTAMKGESCPLPDNDRKPYGFELGDRDEVLYPEKVDFGSGNKLNPEPTDRMKRRFTQTPPDPQRLSERVQQRNSEDMRFFACHAACEGACYEND